LGRRAGTENIPAICGFAKLVEEVIHSSEANELGNLRNVLHKELIKSAPNAIIFSQDAERLSNTIQVSMPGVKSETQLMHFDLNGFCVSAGSACSSGRIEPSHVLLAMGVAKNIAETAIRVSIGWGTTEEEIKAFAQCWKDFYL